MHPSKNRSSAVLIGYVIGSFVFLASDRGVGSDNLSTVALSGQAAPGTEPGVAFSMYETFLSPALNDRGQTSFVAQLTGAGIDYYNREGIWSEGASGQLHLVARAGSLAPGTGLGVNFLAFGIFHGTSLRGPSLNEAGQVAFIGVLDGGNVGGSNVYGIWSEGGGTLEFVAREGGEAPGTPAGVTFRQFTFNGLRLLQSDTGKVAFQADLIGPGVDNDNKSGLWSGAGGSGLSLLQRYGNPAPGTTVNFGEAAGLVMNNLGQSMFSAGLFGPQHNPFKPQGIWSERGGSGPELIFSSGSPAPGTEQGVTFEAFATPPPVAQNDAGQIVFGSFLAGPGVDGSNNRGIWSNGGGSNLELIARIGRPAPGTEPGVNFGGIFGDGFINSRGETAFLGALTGVGVNTTNRTGIWSEGGGSGLRLVARQGSAAPGTEAGVVFNSIDFNVSPVLILQR